MQARWKHDCADCKLVAIVSLPDDDLDIYFCPVNRGLSIWIARYSDYGGDYTSQLEEILLMQKDDPYLPVVSRLLVAFAQSRGK